MTTTTTTTTRCRPAATEARPQSLLVQRATTKGRRRRRRRRRRRSRRSSAEERRRRHLNASVCRRFILRKRRDTLWYYLCVCFWITQHAKHTFRVTTRRARHFCDLKNISSLCCILFVSVVKVSSSSVETHTQKKEESLLLSWLGVGSQIYIIK